MTTEREKERKRSRKRGAVNAVKFLEELGGGPLTFARLMHSIRVCDAMSLTDMANKLGVSRAHLCDIEKERRAVSPQRAARFATILGYSPHQFVELALQAQLEGLDMMVHVEAA